MVTTVSKAVQAKRPIGIAPPPRVVVVSLLALLPAPSPPFPTLSSRAFYTASCVATGYKRPPPGDMATTDVGILPSVSTHMMPRRLITTYAMLGPCQAPPPPSPYSPPPPPVDIPKDNDLYFEEDNDNEGNPELVALDAEFRADEERKATEQAEAGQAEEEDDDDLDLPRIVRVGEEGQR
jgi:hypothetical protein